MSRSRPLRPEISRTPEPEPEPEPETETEALAQTARRALAVGDVPQALALYARLLALRPDDGDLLHLLALLHLQRQERRAALPYLERGLALRPEAAELWLALGVAVQDAGQPAERVALYRRAVVLAPGALPAWLALTQALLAADRVGDADLASRIALTLAPTAPEALAGRGEVLRRSGNRGPAARLLLRALAGQPAAAEVTVNLALVLQAEGLRDEAARLLAHVCATAPADSPVAALAGWNLGLLALERGDLSTGWQWYEARFLAPGLHRPPAWTRPVWEAGQPLSPGQRLRIWSEQGLGDEILFSAAVPPFLAWSARQGVAVSLCCEARLVSLFQRSFPDAAAVTATPAGMAPAGSAEPVDLNLAAGTLAGRVFARHRAFPATSGWLKADPERRRQWRKRLQALGPEPKVGIAWRSSRVAGERGVAYRPLREWRPVLTVSGVRFVNLHHEPSAPALADQTESPITLAEWPESDLRDDLETAAALVAELDLVLCAPTLMGELAAALGVPTWRLSLPGDWTTLGAAVRPWYALQRLFTPQPGEGLTDVLLRMAEALRELVTATAATPPHPATDEPDYGREPQDAC